MKLFIYFLAYFIAHSYSVADHLYSVNIYCFHTPKTGIQPLNEKINYSVNATYDDESKVYLILFSDYEKVLLACKDILKGKTLFGLYAKNSSWPEFMTNFYPIKINFGGVIKKYYESAAAAFGKSVDELRKAFNKYVESFKIVMKKTESFSLPEAFIKKTTDLKINSNNLRVLYVAGLIATYAFKNNEANLPSTLMIIYDILSEILNTKNNSDTNTIATWIDETARTNTAMFKTVYFPRGVEYYPPSIFAKDKDFRIKSDDDLHAFIIQSLNLVTNSLRNY